MRLRKGAGEFFERDVWLGPHDLQQKIHVRCEFAKPTRRATLRLGNDGTVVAMLCRKSHRRRRAHPKKSPC